jgi:hypothetical protein
MLLNYTAQDIFSLLLAILLFTTVLVFPGYVIGWATNLFSFRQRTLPARYVIAIALSNALMPVLLFWVFRYFSNQFGLLLVIFFFILWAVIQIKPLAQVRSRMEFTREVKIALILGGIWVLFCIFLLVDIQIGQRLYNNAASYDFATRTALIDAITRTGIPPINPGYFPGHFERITELYYFWYIEGSVIDMLGGSWVDARITLFAGITWDGLALAATIATYLRIRNPQSGKRAWRASLLGGQLLAVSGLDFIPVMALMIAVKTTYGNLPFDGRMEGWNMPIMSWLNAMTWVPNHVTGLASCIIAMLAILTVDHAKPFRWVINVILAGASIASALGSSLWVPFTFGVFMAVWVISLLFQKRGRALIPAILTAGVLGLAMASPFIIDILQLGGKSQSTGALPIGLYVRPFSFSNSLSPDIRNIVAALLLPINYFCELGFFFMIAMLWIKQRRKSDHWQNDYYWAEIVLLATVAILLSFVKSTVISFNDLGMRGWLLGQFILIVWAVDILSSSSKSQPWLTLSSIRALPTSKRFSELIGILLIVGVMTTALEGSATRFWAMLVDTGFAGLPNELSPDRNLGERTYDARQTYDFIRVHTPQNLIIQNNPTVFLDRPAGLYGSRQLVIADRTAYGVPIEVFREMSTSIGQIFLAKYVLDWVSTDKICSQYSIQAIIINDTDPLWASLAVLKELRSPLYINQHYAVFSCGN